MGKSSKLTQKLLLLEYDYTLSSIIEEYLTDSGFEIVCVYDGESAIDTAYEQSFDLFMLDAKVPLICGFDVLAQLRTIYPQTPAIFITSLNRIEDLTRAYEHGGDDYLRKPFELKELGMRINALLKRSSSLFREPDKVLPDGLEFDPRTGKLTRGNEELFLSKKETKILKTLLSRPNELVNTQELIETAWDFGEEPSEESLRTHIKNLRKLLGKEVILNIRGQGYQIAKF